MTRYNGSCVGLRMLKRVIHSQITVMHFLVGLESGNLLELPKSLLDPRRSLNVTPELQEEGLEPYAPELPLSTLAIISYNLTLERIQRIHTAPSGLESTSLVFAHGLGESGCLLKN